MLLSDLTLIDRPSPNNDARGADAAIDMLVLHYTGMDSTDAAVERLCDPDAAVSAHYLIDDQGAVYRLVPESRRAWHAGVSSWAGDTDINDRSIGIELANPGHQLGYRPFPDAQMTALEHLALDILSRQPIPTRRVVGHSDIAPARKQDPGEFFDWRRLAAKGIGLWPAPTARLRPRPALCRGSSGVEVAAAQSALAAYGYGLAPSGHYDQATVDVVAAFQRHFRPRTVDGAFDVATEALLKALLAMIL
ncbi:MAG TPA: N-acetylmuramoyl-L-alanine amidase [Alphaproteobacteria bacterium]